MKKYLQKIKCQLILRHMNKLPNVLYKSLFLLLRPLVKILLQHGLSAAEFTEITHQVFVDVAENDFSIEGKKQSTARIAVLTGLHRTEVARLRKLHESVADDEAWQFHNRAARVVSGWVRDENFQHQGESKVLPLEGDTGSFSALVKLYSGGMPARAVLDELLRVGTVKLDERGQVMLLQTVYIPHQSDAEKLRYLGETVSDLISTIEYNLRDSNAASRLQLSVAYNNLPKSVVAEFKAWSDQENLALLKKFDKWLAQQEIPEDDSIGGTGRYRSGVGIYYFEEEQQ